MYLWLNKYIAWYLMGQVQTLTSATVMHHHLPPVCVHYLSCKRCQYSMQCIPGWLSVAIARLNSTIGQSNSPMEVYYLIGKCIDLWLNNFTHFRSCWTTNLQYMVTFVLVVQLNWHLLGILSNQAFICKLYIAEISL